MSATVAPAKHSQSPTFPSATLEAALRRELLTSIRAEGATLGVTIPRSDAAASAMAFDLDSLVVVEILCVLDEVLPFEVGESVVRAGGYDSIDEALNDLLPKLADKWKKHLGIKP